MGGSTLVAPISSRRLKEAANDIEGTRAEIKELLKNLVEGHCDGSNGIFRAIRGMLGKTSSFLEMRFKYLRSVPWAFVTADTQAGAEDCVAQMRAHPLDWHDPLARDIWARLEQDLVAVAAGHPCSAALTAEVERLCFSALDESPCEGYHRSTNFEKTRACGSKDVHLKSTVRERQSLQSLKAFVRRYKK